MKNLAIYFACGLWAYVIGAGCALQYQDEQRFAALDSKAQQILTEIAEGKDQSQALADDSLQLALSILDSLQAKQEIVLDDININISR